MTRVRKCVKCGRAQEPISVFGVEIDRCPQCGGLWLDGGEIEQLNEQRRALAGDAAVENAIARLAKREPEAGALAAKPDDQRVTGTSCPACSGKLTTVVFDDTTIEQCAGCDGVFLDRGELEHAMELIDSEEATTILALAESVATSGSIG